MRNEEVGGRFILVEVTGSQKSTYWYAEHIGVVFEVHKEKDTSWNDESPNYRLTNSYRNKKILKPQRYYTPSDCLLDVRDVKVVLTGGNKDLLHLLRRD